jgi:hypothetical protein
MFKFGSVPSLLLLAIAAVSITLTVPGAQGQASGSLNASVNNLSQRQTTSSGGEQGSADQDVSVFNLFREASP